MKKLFILLAAVLFSSFVVAQEKQESYVVEINAQRQHFVKMQDSLTKSIVEEFYNWAYASKFNYEDGLYGLQEFRMEPLPKDITADVTESGIVLINQRLYQWPYTYRKVVWMTLAKHYGVKVNEQNKYFILSEGVNWGDKSNNTYEYRSRSGGDLTAVKAALTKKKPLRSRLK